MPHLLLSFMLCLMSPLTLAAENSPGVSPGEKPTPLTLDSSHLIDTSLGLLLVLAVMLGLAWLVKRFMTMPGQGKGQIQILGGVSLGPRERAVLISVDGQRLLVGVAPGRVQTLHVLPAGSIENQPSGSPVDDTAGGPVDKPADNRVDNSERFSAELQKAEREERA